MKRVPWYQNLQIIAWIAGGLTAAGAFIVGTARYINLPKEVEAAVQKNAQQDESINKLTAIQETWQKIYQQQQQQWQIPNQPAQRPSPRVREWQDPDTGTWWCCDITTGCERDDLWWRCD